jgi:putative effector of murein hydrolase
VSLGAGEGVPLLISDMLGGVTAVAVAVVAILWIFGAAWGWKAFETLQVKYNISLRR